MKYTKKVNVARYATGSAVKGGGFSKNAVGAKVYGSGRSNPTMGPVDKTGYVERDAMLKARRAAIKQQLRTNSRGK